MKKLVLTSALLLAIVGVRTPIHFTDPLPECPPACSTTDGDGDQTTTGH